MGIPPETHRSLFCYMLLNSHSFHKSPNLRFDVNISEKVQSRDSQIEGERVLW